MNGTPWLAVIGPGEADPGEAEQAEAVGAAVAREGAVLVCGGLRGVMEAACRGAHDQGGLTVGLLPGDDRAAANPWVRVAIPTGLGEARNALIVRSADAVVAVGGGWGTLSEIALALRNGLPVIGLDTWQLTREGRLVNGIVEADTPGQAVRMALERAAGGDHARHDPRLP